ncbi:hypothetical protein ACFL2I_05020 [Candidatus Omnitrophota bacterium]
MPKKPIIVSIIIAVFLIAGYLVIKNVTLFSPQGTGAKDTSGEVVTVYFKNGSVMTGELLGKTKDRYIIKWKGNETIVYAELVERIGSPKELALKEDTLLSDQAITEFWPYQNDQVVRLTNRAIAKGKIIRAQEDQLTLSYSQEGAGQIEQDIERAKVEYLIFKPVDNQKSSEIEQSLKEKFPQMSFYKEGNFTIVTDSYITWVREYKKVLRAVNTDIYLKFLELFKDRKPELQNFIVIFDDYIDFVEYAIADGVPGWAVAGYFSPDDKTLYLFNALGEKFSEILFEAMVGESGRTIDDIVDRVEAQVDDRYHIFIEGQAKTIKDKFWDAYTYFKGIYREATMSTLRHEFTHGFFHNWGLQSIELSKVKAGQDELIKKKTGILGAEDLKEKAELIKSLVSLGREPVDVQAANSWLAEGLATYCETDSIGSQNDRWLFIYQEMVKEGPIYPLQSLIFHKMGSFPGVCPKAMLQLYAQSWAFVTFLMEKYPAQFLKYQQRLTQEVALDYQDAAWLPEALNKDLITVEQEFTEYMNTYEPVEDPFVSSFVKLNEIFSY